MTFAPASIETRRHVALISMLRIGARELRSGLGGFHVFIACLALGVMVIAAVGSLTEALREGFARQGETILGGDLTFARMHKPADATESAYFDSLGKVSETATMRTMARTMDGNEQVLVELKAIDNLYPLAGALTTSDGSSPAAAIAGNGAIADPVLLERLGLKVGDKVKIGEEEINIRAALGNEPDAVSDRMIYGPRVFVSLPTLKATGLVKPGTLVDWRYAIKVRPGGPETRDELKTARKTIRLSLPQSGFTSADRYDPAPQITRTLERLRQFLILIGLASLLVGGVGIANAVSTFIDKRMKVIGTLRSVGATGAQVIAIFLTQILTMAAVGIVIGLIFGAVAPVFIAETYGDVLPIQGEVRLSPASLALAATYGFLVALLFALWPLGLAENVRAAALFRNSDQARAGLPRRSIVIATCLLGLALITLAIATSDPPKIAIYTCGGLIFMLAVFGGLGRAIVRIAAKAPRAPFPELALACRNVASPDGLTKSVVLSLGIGLSLLIGVALANSSLVADLTDRLPEKAPDYFLLDIQPSDLKAITAEVQKRMPGAEVASAPMLRGRIVSLNGMPAEDVKVPADAKWVLNGDRGLSYSDAVPAGSTVASGTWWPANYQGPPLISFESVLAKKLGLAIGDKVTVSVLGRNIEATVANLRQVKWENIGINFVMVFTPNALAAAPHNLLATIRFAPNTSAAAETSMVRELGRIYPSVSVIRVRDAIDQFSKLFAKIMVAIEAAGSVTLVAGALVLAGALATAQRRRILEAAILKTLGARRRQIVLAHLYEYALLTLIAGTLAIGVGTLLSWMVVTRLMEVEFTFSAAAVAKTLGLAAAMVLGFGAIGTWLILRARPVGYLRSE
jgi:putative ABC transport system permease protein